MTGNLTTSWTTVGYDHGGGKQVATQLEVSGQRGCTYGRIDRHHGEPSPGVFTRKGEFSQAEVQRRHRQLGFPLQLFRVAVRGEGCVEVRSVHPIHGG